MVRARIPTQRATKKRATRRGLRPFPPRGGVRASCCVQRAKYAKIRFFLATRNRLGCAKSGTVATCCACCQNTSKIQQNMYFGVLYGLYFWCRIVFFVLFLPFLAESTVVLPRREANISPQFALWRQIFCRKEPKSEILSTLSVIIKRFCKISSVLLNLSQKLKFSFFWLNDK